ncbi:MAG: DUF1559 domain-containing protein, partial [Verrucomicrobiae bacterium]|nr:DUF1559 domain-containing protein [Verrucomicrobiae bacterium]
LPALAGARRKARTIQCLSNVKQWTLAIGMYALDYDDFFPYEGQFGAVNSIGNSNAWYNIVAENYAGEMSLRDRHAAGWVPEPGGSTIFACPAAESLSASTNPTSGRFMYGFNNRLDPNESTSWPKRDPFGRRAFQAGDVWRPSVTPVFTENSEEAFPSTSGLYTAARHGSGGTLANLGFVDGHAESVSTNVFRRTMAEDDRSTNEWAVLNRELYWYPFPGAP